MSLEKMMRNVRKRAGYGLDPFIPPPDNGPPQQRPEERSDGQPAPGHDTEVDT